MKLAERTFRIGVQKLWRDPRTGQHWVTIRNRTYYSAVPISLERVDAWRRRLTPDLLKDVP